MAPREQLDIPFIVWQNGDNREMKELEEVGHYHVFHSVIDYLDLRSDIYDEEKSIFN
jgi:lipid A ethanolaminephosphotransferase